MFNLENRVALVTGATGGLGKEIAKALAQQGANVALSGTKEKTLQELKDQIPNSAIFPCSLSNSSDLEKLIPSVESHFGSCDILVNNAGITRDGLLMRMGDEAWDEVININLTASFKLCRSAVKFMIKKKFGRIINISSIVGVTGNPGQTNYCASKAGIIGFSKALAQEVATRGITVNCIAPGFIETPMTEELSEEHRKRLCTSIPMQRIGSPLDIASAVVFLASQETSYITGQTVHVNGGMAMI